jgi:hypothetical protein
MAKVTIKLFYNLEFCEEGIKQFIDVFGDEAEVTLENIRLAIRSGIDALALECILASAMPDYPFGTYYLFCECPECAKRTKQTDENINTFIRYLNLWLEHDAPMPSNNNEGIWYAAIDDPFPRTSQNDT